MEGGGRRGVHNKHRGEVQKEEEDGFLDMSLFYKRPSMEPRIALTPLRVHPTSGYYTAGGPGHPAGLVS